MNNFKIIFVAALALCLFTSTRARADGLGDQFSGHVVVSLGVGIGTLSPSDYNLTVDAFNDGGSLQSSPAYVGSELHVPVLATVYLPYFLLFRTGVEAAYFFPSESGTWAGQSESVTNYGGILEVPIEVGGHMSFLDKRLVVEAALGPAIAAYTSAGLSGSGSTSGIHYYGDPALGFDDEVKGQYFLTPGFSLGLELGYRVLTTSQLHDGNGNPQLNPANGQPLKLDMSGFRAVFELGFVAF